MTWNASASDDERLLTETRAKQACGEWARVRVALLPLFEARPELAAFDRRMFALGEVVWAGEIGEVARVEREG